MVALLERVFPEYRQVSASQIQTELNMFRQDLLGGLCQVSYPSGETYYLFYIEGQLIDFYHDDLQQVVRLENVNPAPFFAGKGDAQLRVCTLSPRLFRHLKTLIYHPREINHLSVQTNRLMAVLDNYRKNEQPAFVHVIWPSAEGFTFLPGKGLPAREFLFLSDSQSQGSSLGVTILSRWPEAECELFYYSCDLTQEVWKENFISLGFTIVFEKLLNRYDDLVGKTLVLRLENNLSSAARSQALNIAFADKSIDDTHTFFTLSDAAAAYRSLFKLASHQMGAVVGPRLVAQALSDALNEISPTIFDFLSEKRIFEITSQ